MAITKLQLPQAGSTTSSNSYPSPPLTPVTTCSKRKRSFLRAATPSLIPSEIIAMAVQAPTKMVFDAAKHLNHAPPQKIYTMSEIAREGQGISQNAVSTPFPLFTEDAVQQMRAEILSKPVLENCQYSSNLAACQLRGFAPKYAPFIYDAWHNPEVLKIVSSIAGVDLIPVMDFEIAHINISINSSEEQERIKKTIADKSAACDEGVAGVDQEDKAPVVDWHTDSYPFVCVLMLSDCSEMVGGETALRTGTGEVMKVRGPGMGNAVILQGRYIEHQALRAIGGSERITMVTSFRPKSPYVKDDTVLTTVRAVSDLSELYGQYSEYRFEMMEERIRAKLKQMRDRKRSGRRFDTKDVKAFIGEQKDFFDAMLAQLVDDDKVVAGFTDATHLISDDLREQSVKKAKILIGEG